MSLQIVKIKLDHLVPRVVLEVLVPRLLGAKPSLAQEGAEANEHEEGSPLEGISADHVQGLAQDPTSSHFLEVLYY